MKADFAKGMCDTVCVLWMCGSTDSIWQHYYVTNGLLSTSSVSVEYSGFSRSIGRQLPQLVSQCVSTTLHTLKTPWNESAVFALCILFCVCEVVS